MTADPKHPLDYASRRRRRVGRRVRVGYLVGALLCVALVFPSWLAARRGVGSMMPMPDPPPAGDPYWVEHANDGRWLILGCCGVALFGVSRLVLLVSAFLDVNGHRRAA